VITSAVRSLQSLAEYGVFVVRTIATLTNPPCRMPTFVSTILI
jgi:hypothetical protein